MVAPVTYTNPLLGIGLYTGPEATRLIGMHTATIRRWLRSDCDASLWKTDLESWNGTVQLSFRDLIELRFVEHFRRAGMSLQGIRWAINRAVELIKEERPFSSSKFHTDGNRIFLEIKRAAESDAELLDVRKDQYVIHDMVAPSFKDLKYEDEAVKLWWPLQGKKTISIDPQRSFGQPILEEYGVPTSALYSAFENSRCIKTVANEFELPIRYVRDAITYENILLN